MTHLHSNPNNLAVLKASSGFSGFALVDADPYDCENQDYRSTNVFYRQIRNVVLDSTSFPAEKAMNLVHWPTAQATSLQNVVFRMSEAPGNKHVGLFIENGM
jgi:glucan 1,3-beta-glucosidase